MARDREQSVATNSLDHSAIHQAPGMRDSDHLTVWADPGSYERQQALSSNAIDHLADGEGPHCTVKRLTTLPLHTSR